MKIAFRFGTSSESLMRMGSEVKTRKKLILIELGYFSWCAGMRYDALKGFLEKLNVIIVRCGLLRCVL